MLRVFTAFSGYDSQCLALNKVCKIIDGFSYDLVGWSEIDRFAIKAHNALFPQWSDRNFGDISRIDWNNVPDFDLLTYSSPCQDFSNAGKMQGGEKGSGTRSSLLWECEKAILAKKPKYLLMENVANLVSKKFIGTFQNWLNVLSELGYTNYCQVLNAKDYGVPQNRKRVFVVSILQCENVYYFPTPIKLTIHLKDVLEKEVEEMYYLYDSKDKRLAQILTEQGSKIQHGDMLDTYDQKIWHEISSTILCGISNRNHHFIAEDPITIQRGHGYNKGGEIKDFTPTITGSTWHFNNILKYGLRIRKYTERECFRLMGVSDESSDKIRSVVSKSQCYKLAGNSIVVDVLVAIFNQLFSDDKTTDKQLKLF